MNENKLIGKNVVSVYLATDNKAIRFDTKDGLILIAQADGDCCSNSWIENVEAPERILGTVLSVEDINMPDQPYDESEYECIAFYGCKIITDKGECVIDYRNESNGYYGGHLVWLGDDSFYGGVYGQNISTAEWRKLS